MDIPFLQQESLSPVERTILMLIERVEELEKEIVESKKENLINAIMCCDGKNNIWMDVFSFLLGISHTDHLEILQNKDFTSIPTNIPDRVKSLARVQLTEKQLWTLTSDDISEMGYLRSNYNYGQNICQVLEAMTYKELQDYWNYRLEWSTWKTGKVLSGYTPPSELCHAYWRRLRA